jgi:uncharacterized protein YndB with AHSA1/START domain
MSREGTAEFHADHAILRFERRLGHPVERVWAAITDPAEIEAWWGRATVDLREGGAMRIEWLNGDVTMPAAITELDPPRLLEIEGEPHGVLRFELRRDGDGTLLTFTTRSQIPDELRSKVLAGWHFHLDVLEDFLEHGTRIDWPNWPLDRWQAIHDGHYAGV